MPLEEEYKEPHTNFAPIVIYLKSFFLCVESECDYPTNNWEEFAQSMSLAKLAENCFTERNKTNTDKLGQFQSQTPFSSAF